MISVIFMALPPQPAHALYQASWIIRRINPHVRRIAWIRGYEQSHGSDVLVVALSPYWAFSAPPRARQVLSQPRSHPATIRLRQPSDPLCITDVDRRYLFGPDQGRNWQARRERIGDRNIARDRKSTR